MSDEQEIPRGYWRSANGNLVPASKVKDIDKRRTEVVEELVTQAKALAEQMRQFKGEAMDCVQAFVDESLTQYDAKLGGKKGNVALISFDGQYKVVRQVSESIIFDERLQAAKALIDECIHKWAKGANANIKALVNDAFQVDQQGKVNTGRVLGLRKLNIDDETWTRAMQAISDSMGVSSSKPYIRFYELDPRSGEYRPICLDIAAL